MAILPISNVSVKNNPRLVSFGMRNDEDDDTYIEKIAYCSNDYECKEPSYCRGYNSPFSVEEINKGSIAWLRHDEAGNLMAGATMLEAIKWLKAAGIKWGILHD